MCTCCPPPYTPSAVYSLGFLIETPQLLNPGLCQGPWAHPAYNGVALYHRGPTFQMNSFSFGKKSCLVQNTMFSCLSLPEGMFVTPVGTVSSANRQEVANLVLFSYSQWSMCPLCCFTLQKPMQGEEKATGVCATWETYKMHAHEYKCLEEKCKPGC